MIFIDYYELERGIQILMGHETQPVPSGSYEPGCSMWDFLLMVVSKRIKHPSIRGKKLIRVDVNPKESQWTYK